MAERSIWAAPDRPGTEPPRAATARPGAGLPAAPHPPTAAPHPTSAARAGVPTRITLPPGFTPTSVPHPTVTPLPSTMARSPSGLFPSGGPPRPAYREPHQTRLSAVALGAVAGTLWMLFFGLLAVDARGYLRWSIAAGVLAWAAALGLARFGIRGVAVGVALSTGLGMAIAGVILTEHWAGGHWLLW
jgi:hypothetical protein